MSLTQKIRQLSFVLAFCLLVFAGGHIAHAEYAQNAYGKCAYGVRTDCTKHTTTTTPTGLQVTVNLKDGQVISPTGYDVVITPLNGQGSSFVSADVFIDGVKVATVYPAANGTATWHWDTRQYPSGNIKIVILDTAGNRTEMPFTVTIGSSEQAGTSDIPQDSSGAESTSWFGSRIADSIAGKSKQFIRALPAPVVRAFPYLLFLLILIEILILGYLARRELRAQQKLKALADRERKIVEMKHKFTMLVSHYLRTPLTILRGGAEGYETETNASETAKKISERVEAIHDSVEAIIAQSNSGLATVTSEAGSEEKSSGIGIGKLLAVWLPVVLIGLLSAVFVYLATSIHTYDATAISILTQAVVFSVLAVAVYVLIRQLQLHRTSTSAARLVLEQEQAIQQAEDTVIHEAATNLTDQTKQLANLITSLPAESVNAKFVRNGFSGLSATVDKFAIASQLKGAVSSEPFSTVPLEDMVRQASADTTAAAEQKHVAITVKDTVNVASRNSTLLTSVLRTLLDNAVAYSVDKGVVEVGKTAKTGVTELYVADHGEGLAPDKVAEVFQPFNRVEEVETFNREGLGFSLYLDKLIMSYLGGDIAVESVPHETTRFVLTLPNPGVQSK